MGQETPPLIAPEILAGLPVEQRDVLIGKVLRTVLANPRAQQIMQDIAREYLPAPPLIPKTILDGLTSEQQDVLIGKVLRTVLANPRAQELLQAMAKEEKARL
jgi:hypothetical protein